MKYKFKVDLHKRITDILQLLDLTPWNNHVNNI